MSFRLPTADHPAREAMGDLAHVANVLNPANMLKLKPVWQAVRDARDAFSDKAVKSVNVIIIRYDNSERWLISVGPKGALHKNPILHKKAGGCTKTTVRS